MQSWLMASIIIIYCLLNIFGIILLAKINPGVQWQWPYFVMSGVGIFVAFFVVSEKYVYGLISIGIMLLGIFYQYIPANPILNFGQKTETKSIKNLFYKYTPRVSKTFLFLCAGFVWCFAGYKILGMGITDMTVSYTHLYVYKRQPYSF